MIFKIHRAERRGTAGQGTAQQGNPTILLGIFKIEATVRRFKEI